MTNKPSTEKTTTKLSRTAAIERFRAIVMIPPADHEPPLTIDELKPQFGGPVSVGEVDYSELTKLYRLAVHGQKSDPKLEAWLQRPLREFETLENTGAMLLNHRLLVWHDTQAHRQVGYKRFEKWLADIHDFAVSRTTAYRRVGHARLALLLAVAGKIDLLPTQNVAGRIAHWLPRTHWVPYLSVHPEKSLGEAAVDKKVFLFAKRYRIPLRREPAIPPECSDAACSAPVHPLGGARDLDNAITARPPVKIPAKTLTHMLSAAMGEFFPPYKTKSIRAATKALLTATAELVRTTPKPARNPRRAMLQASIRAADPVRAKEIETAALMHFYAVVEKKLFEKCSMRGTSREARPNC